MDSQEEAEDLSAHDRVQELLGSSSDEDTADKKKAGFCLERDKT